MKIRIRLSSFKKKDRTFFVRSFFRTSYYLFCESGCLFDDVDFSVTFDAVEQQDRQRYSSLVHCWMVCFAFGGTLKNGNAPIKVSRHFDVKELKDHRRFYFGITKGERWPDIHIFDKRDMWEVVRI